MSSLRIFDSEDHRRAVRNREAMEAAAGQQLPPLPPRSRKGKEKVGDSGGCDPDNEVHVATERVRREKMRTMFINLHAMLPQLPAKADKTTILNEAIAYIKTLECTLQTLKKKKLERIQKAALGHYETQKAMSSAHMQLQPLNSWAPFLADQGQLSNNLAMTTNMVAPNNLAAPFFPPSFSTYTAPNAVLNLCGNDAQISVCCTKKPGMLTMIFYFLQNCNLEVVSAHISSEYNRSMHMIHAHAAGFINLFQVEEICKLAVEEINLWISSA